MLIRTRLILIGLLPWLLFLAFIVAATMTQYQLDLLREKVALADNMGKTIFNLTVIAHDLEENKSERSRQQWPSMMREIELKLPRAREIYSSADESELLAIFIEHIEDSRRDFRELAQWSAQHQGETLSPAQQSYLASLSKNLQIDVQSAMPVVNKIAMINKKNAEAFAGERANAMIVALLFLGGAILLVLWPMMRSITRSIDYLKTSMGKVALGDLDLRISATGKDEFSELARRFNEMAEKLAQVTVARETLSAEVLERKRAEDSLRATTDSLNEAQRIAHIGSWTLDLLNNKLAWSDEVFHLFEIDPNRFGATYEAFLDAIHPEDRDAVNRAYTESLANRTPYEITHRLLMSDGRIKWVQERCVTHFDAAGKPQMSRGTVQDITEHKLSAEKIESLAFYDPLTRLPNRRLLLDRLQQALVLHARSGRQGALMFIDLDNFKNINDTQGHAVGDLLLAEVASRLQSCVREGDTIARTGGDEFIVLLEDMDADEQVAANHAETVGEKILEILGQPYNINGNMQRSTVSIGITLFRGSVKTTEEMLQRADVALYQAKAGGRNTMRFFDPAMQASVAIRVALESDLRRAVALQEEFQLYYQAQVDSSGRQTGAEALLRWLHPVRGMISPAEFIPLAEETGLILPLGHWVMATACQQLANWAARPELSHLTLAVNISAKQFHLSTFVDEVLTLVDYFGIDPAKLKLEITESMMVSNVDDIIDKIAALKARGINFSIDDFGTGYSSLQYLKRLPLDQLKIDRSFVRDIVSDDNDKAIMRTIIAMAHSLNLSVIAEGVETEEQRQLLLSNGCTAYQGYLFGRPAPIDQFESSVAGNLPFFAAISASRSECHRCT